jgi:hypothetical protein
MDSFVDHPAIYSLPQTKLLKNSKELNIWSHYRAPTSVGRKISGVGDNRRPEHQGEKEGVLQVKSEDMFRIDRIFSKLISFST